MFQSRRVDTDSELRRRIHETKARTQRTIITDIRHSQPRDPLTPTPLQSEPCDAYVAGLRMVFIAAAYLVRLPVRSRLRFIVPWVL
jgi:hypothetical protein